MNGVGLDDGKLLLTRKPTRKNAAPAHYSRSSARDSIQTLRKNTSPFQERASKNCFRSELDAQVQVRRVTWVQLRFRIDEGYCEIDRGSSFSCARSNQFQLCQVRSDVAC